MTDRPILFSAPMIRALLDGRKTQTRRVLKPQLEHVDGECFAENYCPVCDERMPYAVGDRLWVKEAFAEVGHVDPGWFVTKADYPKCVERYGFDSIPETIEETGFRWQSPIFMPRRLSRLTLVVTRVRVERVQDISDEDAKAEGVKSAHPRTLGSDDIYWQPDYLTSFRQLWNELNAKRGFDWGVNPWVVALSFDVHRENIDRVPA